LRLLRESFCPKSIETPSPTPKREPQGAKSLHSILPCSCAMIFRLGERTQVITSAINNAAPVARPIPRLFFDPDPSPTASSPQLLRPFLLSEAGNLSRKEFPCGVEACPELPRDTYSFPIVQAGAAAGSSHDRAVQPSVRRGAGQMEWRNMALTRPTRGVLSYAAQQGEEKLSRCVVRQIPVRNYLKDTTYGSHAFLLAITCCAS